MSDFQYKIEIVDATPEDMKQITNGLNEHALKAANISWQLLNILLRQDNGLLKGGLIAYQAGETLMINLLWVDNSQRKQGLGRALMKRAEGEAVKRKCNRLRVDTFSYQAPEFYKKLGFQHTVTINNFCEGYDRIFLEKNLA